MTEGCRVQREKKFRPWRAGTRPLVPISPALRRPGLRRKGPALAEGTAVAAPARSEPVTPRGWASGTRGTGHSGPVGTEGQRRERGTRGSERGSERGGRWRRRGAQAGYGVVPQRLLQGCQRRRYQDGHQRPGRGQPAVRRRECQRRLVILVLYQASGREGVVGGSGVADGHVWSVTVQLLAPSCGAAGGGARAALAATGRGAGGRELVTRKRRSSRLSGGAGPFSSLGWSNGRLA